MAFLDNSGDIILDAVLTDEGRRRLALGNGSFRITKFALADDEIDYSLYTPVTGSGFQDLRILQLPIFEAFTNNMSSVKSKLLTYADNTLFYLPVIKLNTKFGTATVNDGIGPVGGYYLSADVTTTEHILGLDNNAASQGYRFANVGAAPNQSQMIFDQGLDTADLALGYLFGQNQQEQSMLETAYLVEVDNRLLSLTTPTDQTVASPQYIDDDNIATYYFSMGMGAGGAPAMMSPYFARQNGGRGGSASPAFDVVNNPNAGIRAENSMIGPTETTGRLGSRLVFGLRSSLSVQTGGANSGIFPQLGGQQIITLDSEDTNYHFINTVVRVTGFNTGYRVEVPVKIIKKMS